MCGAPGVVVVAPGVGAGLDRGEAVDAVFIGHAAAGAEEVRIDRRVVLVGGVDIAAGGVCLPEFQHSVWYRATVIAEHATGDDDAFAEWLAVAPAVSGEVVVQGVDAGGAVDRAGVFGQGWRDFDHGLGWAAQHAGAILRVDQRRLGFPVAGGPAIVDQRGFVHGVLLVQSGRPT